LKSFIFQKQWSWRASGIALGLAFLLAVALVKPIGVSTQFVILDGMAWDLVYNDLIVKDSSAKKGYSSSNVYLNKSGGKYAKNAATPINYSFIFVIAMIVGGFIADRLQSDKESKEAMVVPAIWQSKFGQSPGKRHMATFVGGVLVLIGARLAGGCTSGHMMSGMMQTSLSGYLFTIGTFAVAVPVAIYMYKGVE